VSKKIYKIDVAGAAEVSKISGLANLLPKAVSKTLFLDVVVALNAKGIASFDIPAKLEGIAFGQDVVINGVTKHTLFISSDNDYSPIVPNKNHATGTAENPNTFFVFAFDDDDLPGFVPQRFHRGNDHDDRDW
jgi:Esterase-like activity of phytase